MSGHRERTVPYLSYFAGFRSGARLVRPWIALVADRRDGKRLVVCIFASTRGITHATAALRALARIRTTILPRSAAHLSAGKGVRVSNCASVHSVHAGAPTRIRTDSTVRNAATHPSRCTLRVFVAGGDRTTGLSGSLSRIELLLRGARGTLRRAPYRGIRHARKRAFGSSASGSGARGARQSSAVGLLTCSAFTNASALAFRIARAPVGDLRAASGGPRHSQDRPQGRVHEESRQLVSPDVDPVPPAPRHSAMLA